MKKLKKITLNLIILIIFLPISSIAQNSISEANKLFSKGKFKKSIKVFDKIIESSLKTKPVYSVKDKKAFEKIIESNSKIKLVYLGRAEAYYKLGDYKSAISDYSKVIELDRYYRDAIMKRAGAYYKIQQYELAIIDYTKFLEKEVKNKGKIYFLRGLCKSLLKNQDVEGACDDFKKAKSLGFDTSSLKGLNEYCNSENLE
jgi:tetratricopeptide (TPR) repeat protein